MSIPTNAPNTMDFSGLFIQSQGGVRPVATGFTAGTVQTQAGATLLTTIGINTVDTNATAGNGVRLPSFPVGATVIVSNTTVNAVQVYGAGTDTINAVATATGVSIPAGKTAEFFATSLISGVTTIRMNLSA